jgi:hypothetical protein
MIIYIVGYGRSGSTALSRILEDKLNAVNLGEAKFLYRDEYDDLVDDFWIRFKKNNKEIILENSSFLKKSDSIFGLLVSNSKKYKKIWDYIFSKIGVEENKNIIIDSSKTTIDSYFRGFKLYGCYEKVYFLFPNRSFLNVTKSLLKGDNANLERGEKKIFIKRLIHTVGIGIPHLLITRFLTQFYKFYGMEVIDINNLESEVDRFISRYNLSAQTTTRDIPMIFGNRNRKNI